MRKIECPFCDTEFEADEWDMGKCPNCKEEYWWEEDCLKDYSDCWTCVVWNYDKLNKRRSEDI